MSGNPQNRVETPMKPGSDPEARWTNPATDEFQFFLEQEWSDGFPVVTPTEARVQWMLSGTRCDREELIGHVRSEISPIATPEVIHFAAALPKTRSGKIMRRILRKIANGDLSEIGDTSPLADPSVVETLVETRPARG